MIKKAVILAAGRGKRMKELTKFLPKSLVAVNNRPFLFYKLKILKELGFNRIGIIVHYKKDRIKEFLKKNKFKAFLIEQKRLLGTGDALKVAKDFVGNDNFIVLMGDDYYSQENIELISKKDDGHCYVLGYRHEQPEKFGVLIEKNGFLKKIIEKPKKSISNLVNIGLYKFTPEIFEALEKIKISERGEYELPSAISFLAAYSEVKVIKTNKGWLCMNIPDDLEAMELVLQKTWLKNFKNISPS